VAARLETAEAAAAARVAAADALCADWGAALFRKQKECKNADAMLLQTQTECQRANDAAAAAGEAAAAVTRDANAHAAHANAAADEAAARKDEEAGKLHRTSYFIAYKKSLLPHLML
jgi:hypothetical protein